MNKRKILRKVRHLRSKIEIHYLAGIAHHVYWNEIVPGVWTCMGVSRV